MLSLEGLTPGACRSIRLGCLAATVATTTVLILFPYGARMISVSDRVGVQSATTQMAILGEAVQSYRLEQGGKWPPSAEAILAIASRTDSAARADLLNGAFGLTRPHSGASAFPFMSCYIPAGPRDGTLVWIDADGRLYTSRVWLWPTWRGKR